MTCAGMAAPSTTREVGNERARTPRRAGGVRRRVRSWRRAPADALRCRKCGYFARRAAAPPRRGAMATTCAGVVVANTASAGSVTREVGNERARHGAGRAECDGGAAEGADVARATVGDDVREHSDVASGAHESTRVTLRTR
jgi:hypothetical protein